MGWGITAALHVRGQLVRVWYCDRWNRVMHDVIRYIQRESKIQSPPFYIIELYISYTDWHEETPRSHYHRD